MFVVHIIGNGRVKPPGQSNKPSYGCQVTVQVTTIMFRFKESHTFTLLSGAHYTTIIPGVNRIIFKLYFNAVKELGQYLFTLIITLHNQALMGALRRVSDF